MISSTLPQFWELFWKLPPEIRRRAQQTYRQFERNPNHPSLHFKQLKGRQPPIYSIRINNDYRALGRKESDDLIVWFWIGTHAGYDKQISVR